MTTESSTEPSHRRIPWIRTLLTLLLVFLFGVLSGLGGGALFMKHRIQQAFRDPQQMNGPGERIIAHLGDHLKRELDLTDAQHQAVARELEATRQDLLGIRQEAVGNVRQAIKDTQQRLQACLPRDKHESFRRMLRDKLEPWGMAR